MDGPSTLPSNHQPTSRELGPARARITEATEAQASRARAFFVASHIEAVTRFGSHSIVASWPRTTPFCIPPFSQASRRKANRMLKLAIVAVSPIEPELNRTRHPDDTRLILA